MKFVFRSISYLFFILLLMLIACTKAPTPGTSPLDSPIVDHSSTLPTPLLTSTVYLNDKDIVRFDIDEPLLAGESRVTGVGPAGFEISLVNVTTDYEMLGSGKVSPNGRFDIKVTPSLLAGHRIGIITATPLSSAEFEKYAGDGQHFSAQGGWVLESTIVTTP